MSEILLPGARVRVTTAGRGEDPLRQNYGLHVGDDPLRVNNRRKLLAEEVGRPIIWMDQTHSTTVLPFTCDALPPHSAPGQLGPVRADGLVLDLRACHEPPALAVMTADCLPLILSAPGKMIAAVHIGRVGLLGGILSRCVDVVAGMGIPLESVHGFIGPAACKRCYELPEDMVHEAEERYPGSASLTSWGTPALDLSGAARRALRAAGLKTLDVDPRCTIEDHFLHSHRRNACSGRQVCVVVATKHDLSGVSG